LPIDEFIMKMRQSDSMKFPLLIKAGLIGWTVLVLVSCMPALDRWLTDATDRATQEDITQGLGEPTQKTQLDGKEVWSYRMTHVSYAGSAGSNSCFQYLLTFDAQKILRKWEVQRCG
jgi:hypothetical protein